MWFHIQKRMGRNKDGEEEETSFVSVLLKISLSPISRTGLLSDCNLGEAVRACLICSRCSHFPVPLCILALQISLLDGDTLSSKEQNKFHTQ